MPVIGPGAIPAAFPCIVVDPPWHEPGGHGRGADQHYSTIRHWGAVAATIAASPLWRPAPSTHVWLWTTVTSLVDGIRVLDALSAKYTSHVVWSKDAIGLGRYTRVQHELLLLGVVGSIGGGASMASPRSAPVTSVWSIPVDRDDAGKRIHSRKPGDAFARIEQISIGPRASLFERVPRAGWWCWGDEVAA